jgi:hypothetical protein
MGAHKWLFFRMVLKVSLLLLPQLSEEPGDLPPKA